MAEFRLLLTFSLSKENHRVQDTKWVTSIPVSDFSNERALCLYSRPPDSNIDCKSVSRVPVEVVDNSAVLGNITNRLSVKGSGNPWGTTGPTGSERRS